MLIIISLLVPFVLSDPENSGFQCIPQGYLILDDRSTHPQASLVEWPHCQQYQSCSCCNISHVLTIHKHHLSDQTASPDCQTALAEVACLVCHPEIGIGTLETVCKSQCDRWYRACRSDYFAFDHISSKVAQCKADSKLVCSQLEQLVESGVSFCAQIGIKASQSDDEECWFSDRPINQDLCFEVKEKEIMIRVSDAKYLLLLPTLVFVIWILPRFIPPS